MNMRQFWQLNTNFSIQFVHNLTLLNLPCLLNYNLSAKFCSKSSLHKFVLHIIKKHSIITLYYFFFFIFNKSLKYWFYIQFTK